MKFARKPIRHYPHHLRHVATLSWEIKNSNFLQIFSRYGRKCKQLHFKYTHFNSTTHVTEDAQCIYVFLSKSCSLRWISCWLLTHTAMTSAVANFGCHKLIVKVNKLKNSDMKNIICNQYAEKLAILKHRRYQNWWVNKKVRGDKNAMCLHFSIVAEYLQKIWFFNFPR